MGRKAFKSPEEKVQIVLTVLRGEMTQTEIARQLQMSQTTIAKWQKQFLEGAHESLARGDNAKPPGTRREMELQDRIDDLTQALGESLRRVARVAQRGGSLPTFAELEVIRVEGSMTVVRFCARLGIPTSTWYYWRTAHVDGRDVHRWPAPVVDLIEEPVAEKAEMHSAWGHRKIWGLMRRDGYVISQSSVKRAMARRELLPVRYQAERRALAKARRRVFDRAPKRRNRVWQTDFSDYETPMGEVWQISGYVDYAAKICLAAAAYGTETAVDALVSLRAAIAEAERLLGHSLLDDCVDPDTGEIIPLVIVSDNGACYKSDAFARFIASRPELYHVRTRIKAPWTNGGIERWFQSLKYEHLFRQELTNGYHLGVEISEYRHLYNEVRPHEHLPDELVGFLTPLEAYLRPQPPDEPPFVELPAEQPPMSYNPPPPRPRSRYQPPRRRHELGEPGSVIMPRQTTPPDP